MQDLIINSRLRVSQDEIIHVVRRFSASSNWTLQAAENQEVSPSDILGEAEIFSGFRTIKLAEDLKINPKLIQNYLKKKLGQSIYQGEILAEKEGILGFRKTLILSPNDGVVDWIDSEKGEVRIKMFPKKTKLASGVYGVIDQIDRQKGWVVIRTQANIIYGVCGSGSVREGLLSIMDGSGALTSSRQVSQKHERQIVVSGAFVFADALQQALNLKIGGIVCGGINAGDFLKMTQGQWNIRGAKWFDNGISLMVTEGFGSNPIGKDIFEVLKPHHGCFAILDGNKAQLILPTKDQQGMISIHKTKLPKVVTDKRMDRVGIVRLEVGMRVRITSSPNLGVQGEVVGIDKTQTLLPSGIKAILATVECEHKKVKIPYANLEAI